MNDDKVLVSRELLERVTNPANEVAGRNARIELADLLDQPSDGALTNEGAEPVHPPEVKALVLPERRTQDGWQFLTSQDLGWNACLDRVKELNS